MSSTPTRLPAAITVYCAQCKKTLAPSEERYLYARVRCPNNDKHLAAVVKGPAGEFWLGVEAGILKWEAEYSPMRWFNRWGGVFKGRAGRYLAARFAVMVLLLTAAWLVPKSPGLRIVMAVPLTAAVLLLLADILVSNTSLAFVSRFPAYHLRTAILTAFAFVQIAIAFAAFHLLFSEFNRDLNPISATYFSFVTITTLGYGDIQLVESAWLGQIIVMCELVVGVFFLSTLFAVVANWSNAPPTAPPILALTDVSSDHTSNSSVQPTGSAGG